MLHCSDSLHHVNRYATPKSASETHPISAPRYKSEMTYEDPAVAALRRLANAVGGVRVVAFTRANTAMLCSVGIESMEIEQAGVVGRTLLNKQQLAQALARRKVRDEEISRVVAGDHGDFIKKAKLAITARFKDPDSAKFRSLYISNKALPTLCGEVNAKNSYGGYVGYRGFIYNEAGQFLDDGKELGEGFLYRSMFQTSCSEKFADVTEP